MKILKELEKKTFLNLIWTIKRTCLFACCEVQDETYLILIIPCYNEEEPIQETHRRVTKVMEDGFSLRSVYVNDGSRDGTAELLNTIQAEDKAVRLIHFAANRDTRLR